MNAELAFQQKNRARLNKESQRCDVFTNNNSSGKGVENGEMG